MDPFSGQEAGNFSAGGEAPLDGLPGDISSFFFDDQPPGLGTYSMGDEGLMELVTGEDDLMPVTASGTHTENLAETLDESWMSKTARDLLDQLDEDIESRAPWRARFQRGMEMMGLVDDEMDDGPFPGASTAVMPIISEAAVQFWARALAEQVPSDGPVKGKVLGKANQAQAARADRVATYMNHDMLFVDRSWYADHSRMMFALPLHGSCFKKTYRDHNAGRNTGEYIPAEDFICNYQFTHLDNAPRFAHRLWRTENEMRKAVVAGVYREIVLGDADVEDLPEETGLRIEIQDFDPGDDGRSARHELYEVYCELDIPGHEELDANGVPTGVALPYIVTIDKASEQVVAIYRNWKEGDPLKRRRICFTKYDFIPGMGFYGLGLFHLIGGLQQAATGALRAVIDGAATASLQGGFISKDASLKDQRLVVEPGVWTQLDATSEDLNKAFFTPPFKEPSPVLFQVIGFLVSRAEKFTATTETMTGAGDPKGSPVGTTSAMIEQGAKVLSTVHRGLHRSLAEELRLRYDLIQEFLPVEGYPYDVDGQHEGLMGEDFAPGISVLPVSDPNIFTQAQRVAQAQAVYDLSQQNPDLIKRPVALRRVLEAINVPDLDEIFIGEQQPPEPMDPVSEIQALLRGDPVKAYPDQDHQAHIQHYWAFLNNPEYGGNPEVQKQIQGPAIALLGQRLAYAWASHAQALSGQMQPALPPPGGDPQGQPQVPQAQLAQMAAQIAPGMVKVPGLPATTGADGGAQQKLEMEQAKLQAKGQEVQIKGAEKAQSMQLKADEHAQKLEMQREAQAFKLELAQMQADIKLQIETVKAEAEAKAAEQKAQMQAFQQAYDMQRQAEQTRMQEAQAQQDMILQQAQVQQEGAINAAQREQEAQATAQDMQLKRQTAQNDMQVKRTQAAAKPKARKP